MTHPLTILGSLGASNALDAIDIHHDHYKRYPTVNVKQHVGIDNIPWDTLRDEFDDHVDTVKAWAETLGDDSAPFEWALAWARDRAWEDAQEEAREIFGDRARVYSAGRSGGHLVVHGIGDPYDWTHNECAHTVNENEYCYDWDCDDTFDMPDHETVTDWYQFKAAIEAIRDDIPYQTGWELIVNQHDRIHDLEGVI